MQIGLYLVSFALSLVYFVSPSPITKALPILVLGIFSFLEGKKYGILMGIGLLLSAVGDVLLALDDTSDIDLFIFGLLSFLVAHLFYVAGYFFNPNVRFTHGVLCGVYVLLYYGGMMYVLLPSIDEGLKIPVIIYGGVISTMLFTALNRYFSRKILGTSRALSLVGSLFFVASDTILAVNKFSSPFANAHRYTMITYYIGQTLIAASVKNAEEPAKVVGKKTKQG